MKHRCARMAGSVAIALLVLFPCLARAPAGDKPDADKSSSGNPGSGKQGVIEWLAAKPAIEKSSRERLPLFVVWAGAKSDEFWKRFDAELASSRTFKERFPKFVPAKVVDAKNEDFIQLGPLEDESAIFLLDFLGNVLYRWSGEIPRGSVAAKQMEIADVRNAEIAVPFAKAEELVKKCRYAIELEKHREAVLFLLDGEKLSLPSDTPPAKDLAQLRARLQKLFDEKIAVGLDLEEKEKYSEAITHYEQMRKDFPFPDRSKELDRRISSAMAHTGR